MQAARDIGNTPQLEAPTLAELARKIDERPFWELVEKLPLPVDPDTFDRAAAEMKDVLARQGRPVAKAPWLKQENFLLRGIPVVKSNDL